MTDEILKTEDLDKKPKEVKKPEEVVVIKFRKYGNVHYVKNIATKEVKEISEQNVLFNKDKTVFAILLKDYDKLKTIKKGH